MHPQPIRRRVSVLDTSNQMPLFTEGSAPIPESSPAETLAGAVRFVDPDPRAILINQVRLDQYLNNAGQTAALKVRELLVGLDWEPFERDYQAGGRPPYSPRAMLGLVLFGIMHGNTSLRDLESCARTDLGCLWITGGIRPDHSVIGRFIQRHESVLSETFFETLTRQVLQVTGGGTSVVAGDGTVIEAAASRYRTVKAEALAEQLAKQRQAQAEAPTAHGEKALERLEQAQETLQQRQAARQARGKAGAVQINPQEPEAVNQPQKDKKRFAPSYKPSVLANEQRVIVGVGLDASSETKVVAPMLDQAQQLGEVETALFDAGYFGAEVIDAAERREIELLCPEGQSHGESWNKRSEKYYPKSRYEYDPIEDAYRCPADALLRRCGAYKGNEGAPAYALYRTDACAQCAQRGACTRSEQGRKIKRYLSDDAKDALRTKLQDPQVRARYRQRQAMVEPVFAHLRYNQGLQRFRRKGLAAVRLEFNLHAMAYNLGRAVVLGSWDFIARFAFLRALLRCIGIRIPMAFARNLDTNSISHSSAAMRAA